MLSRLLFRHLPPVAADLRSVTAFPVADPRAVVAALAPAGRRIAVADPSGWISVALLLAGAEVIPVGPSLLWLWIASTELHYVEARQLWGLDSPGRRIFLYHQVKGRIPPEASAGFEGVEPAIRAGLLTHAPEDGFARRIAMVRTPTEWIGADEARRKALARSWAGPRFRLAIRGLPADDVLDVLTRVPLRESPWAQRLLFGSWRTTEALPEGLQPDGHRALAGLAGKVVSGTTADATWGETGITAPIQASIGRGTGEAAERAATVNRRWDAPIRVISR